MGSYSTLFIRNIDILSFKYEIEPMIMTLFRPHECQLRRGRPEAIAPHLVRWHQLDDTEEHEFLFCEASLSTIIQRLDLIGFTLSFIQKEWEEWKDYMLTEIYSDESIAVDSMRWAQLALTHLDWDTWLRLACKIIKAPDKHNKDRSGYKEPSSESDIESIVLWYMRTHEDDWFEMFLLRDTRMAARVFCEGSEPNDKFIYDLSDLLWSGTFEDADAGVTVAKSHMDGHYSNTQRIIVITEGKTDQKVLERTLALLRPSTKDFFSFLDFETMAIQGGAIGVLNIVKAFVSAGVVNRIVALLDNDTAAHVAVRSTKLPDLPANVRILHLPDLPAAEEYPTIGPAGMTVMNINGLACSIELFFGADVLRDENGELTPIQWKGYEEKLKRYQGEILHKPRLQEKFFKKTDKDTTTGDVDWLPMEAILQVLETAFSGVPPLHYGLHHRVVLPRIQAT